MIGVFQTWSLFGQNVFFFILVTFPKLKQLLLVYNGDLLPLSRSLSKIGILKLPLVGGHFLSME